LMIFGVIAAHGSGSLSDVAMGDEGHRNDLRVMDLAALREHHAAAGGGAGGGDIGHGDRLLDARREAARRDLADFGTLGIDHRRALADRLAALDDQADALEDRAVLALQHEAFMPGETAFLAAALLEREAEAGGDR